MEPYASRIATEEADADEYAPIVEGIVLDPDTLPSTDGDAMVPIIAVDFVTVTASDIADDPLTDPAASPESVSDGYDGIEVVAIQPTAVVPSEMYCPVKPGDNVATAPEVEFWIVTVPVEVLIT